MVECRINSEMYMNVSETDFMPPLTRIFGATNLNSTKF